MAPEVIDAHLGQTGGFDEQCDIYSLGICAFELLVGRPPYQPVLKGGNGPVDYAATRSQIETMDLATVLSKEVGRSEGAVDIVQRMLAVDPKQRPSASELLLHRWLAARPERAISRQISVDGPQASES